MDQWQTISGGSVLLPPRPLGVIHFLGGAFVGVAPQLTYKWLLEQLAAAGYAIVVTPFINTFDHWALARQSLNQFETILDRLQTNNLLVSRYLPIYGLGHSMGSKLHLLMGSAYEIERAGNILISFNNYPVQQAIPLAGPLANYSPFELEFSPSPTETQSLIAEDYQIRRNLLIRFRNDSIDQTGDLQPLLQQRHPGMVAALTLPGNHLTPLGQDWQWQVGEVFSPLDAVGQWVKQEFYGDLQRLQKEICRWLQPFPHPVP